MRVNRASSDRVSWVIPRDDNLILPIKIVDHFWNDINFNAQLIKYKKDRKSKVLLGKNETNT